MEGLVALAESKKKACRSRDQMCQHTRLQTWQVES